MHFNVMNDTLHFTVALIDKFVSKNHGRIPKTDLQLIGVSCMKIADVFLERSKEYYRQENAYEYAYITADEFSKEQVVETEKKILGFFDFEIQFPTAMSFFKLMTVMLEHEEISAEANKYITQVGSFACYLTLLDISLMTDFAPSVIASSCLCIAFKVL
jgi:hypothetical protein